MSQWRKVVRFLCDIGIQCTIQEESGGFLNLIRIENGTLIIDPKAPIHDILHEAGHLAIVPNRWRHLMNGNVGNGQREMLRLLEEMDLHPDDPLSRATMATSENEAIAWSWSAGVYLRLKPTQIIQDTDDPKVFSGQAWAVRQQLEWGDSLGSHGLAYAGWCATNKTIGRHRSLPVYPELKHWTQEL